MFMGEEATADDSCDKPMHEDHEKPKDQGKEIDEMNLSTWKEESQPIFISANLLVELRRTLFTIS